MSALATRDRKDTSSGVSLGAETRRTDVRNALVLKNQPLARKIATNVWKTNRHLPYEDLVSAGTMGLIKAIDRHDPTQTQLSTFAYPYIYGEIQREIRDKWQPVKIGRKHYERRNKLRKLDELGLDEATIAQALGISINDLRETREAIASLQLGEWQDDTSHQIQSDDAPSPVMDSEEGRRSFAGVPPVELTEQEESSDSLLRTSPRAQQIFELICCWGRTTTTAIAHHLKITQGRARGYTGRLRKAGLIVRDGYFYQPNFKQVVIEGIKKQVQQKIEVVNYLAKLQEVIEIRAKLKKLEEELIKVGGERAQWLLKTIDGNN